MTFLEIANNVAVKVRLPELTTCFSSSDRNAKAIKSAIIDAAERDVFRKFDWSFLLTRGWVITSGITNYELAPDYNRSIMDSFWNSTSQRKIIGPVDTQTWAMYQNDAFGVSAIDYVCTIMSAYSGEKRLYLIPSSYDVSISYYYVSDRYVKSVSQGGVLTNSFISDDDTTVFDDELVEQAALYRTLRILGLDYGEERYEYSALLKERMSHDGGARILNMAEGHADSFILGANTPLTGMGG